MYSDVVKHYMKKERQQVLDILSIPKDYLLHLIYDADDREMTVFQEEFNNQMIEKLKERPDMVVAFKNMSEALSAIDVEHSFYNALHFEISDKAFSKEGDPSELGKLDCEDVIFDFRNENYLFRIGKNRYKLEVGGKLYDCYNGILTYKPIKNVKNTMIVTNDVELVSASMWSLEFTFVLEKLPRIFIPVSSVCDRCGKCRVSDFVVHNPNGFSFHEKFFVCGLRNRNLEDCNVSVTINTPTNHTLEELMNVCFYAIGMYNNRRKRKIDTTEENGILLKPKTIQKKHEARNQKSKITFVSLKEYNRVERRIKREYQGGTHSSPVEHERRSHLRHYKNGKVVEVRSTIVNKGKGEGNKVYKV